MSRTETVTFNVGGEKFQVARSLLDFYPDSVLAKSISERWKQQGQDPDQEIFFDRCPQLFRQVLEYLRNKKVHLPITVSKKAVLSEFEHYCVENVEEEAIDDNLTQRAQYVQYLKDTEKYVAELNKEMDQGRSDADSAEVAKYIFTEFRSNPGRSCCDIQDMSKKGGLFRLSKVNEYLARVGLKIEKQPNSWQKYYSLSELST